MSEFHHRLLFHSNNLGGQKYFLGLLHLSIYLHRFGGFPTLCSVLLRIHFITKNIQEQK